MNGRTLRTILYVTAALALWPLSRALAMSPDAVMTPIQQFSTAEIEVVMGEVGSTRRKLSAPLRIDAEQKILFPSGKTYTDISSKLQLHLNVGMLIVTGVCYGVQEAAWLELWDHDAYYDDLLDYDLVECTGAKTGARPSTFKVEFFIFCEGWPWKSISTYHKSAGDYVAALYVKDHFSKQQIPTPLFNSFWHVECGADNLDNLMVLPAAQ
jgi:hypothetical protein